jgi:cytochrome c oxidase subunit 2
VFLAVPVLGLAVMFWAPDIGMGLPPDVSEHGHEIDHLFMFCLILTGVIFLITEVVLFWFMWRYERRSNRDPVIFTHGSHNLELVWTIIPALTLLFIALYQMNAWADVKIRKPKDAKTIIEVTARQFEWRIRYPGEDNVLHTPDDILDVNTLHVPLDEEVIIELKSMDVLHDFFVPQLRVKQDAVPGTNIPVWFRAQEPGEYDLVCAELCGWGHYKMKGQVTVESREDYEAWLKQLKEEQEATQ